MKRNGLLHITFGGLGCIFGTCVQAATLDSTLSIQSQQYATDASPGGRLGLQVHAVSDDIKPKERALPARELHGLGFFETGPGGDYSADLDRTALRLDLKGTGYLWLGRVHPLSETTQGATPVAVDAVGANWTQNQSDALAPRVSGWISAGTRVLIPETALSLTVAYSPIFLPSFGPSLQLSETNAAKGSRYSRLPPQYVQIGSSEIPLRYRLNVGDIGKIVFQDQGFIDLGQETPFFRFDLMAWSAPNPNASVDTSAALQIHSESGASNSLDALVDAKPRFERQTFIGTRWDLKGVPAHPLLSSTYETHKREWTASAQLEPTSFFRLGGLHRWAAAPENVDISNPAYADRLIWGEAYVAMLQDRLRPALRMEQNLSNSNSGRIILPRIVYLATPKLNLFALAQIITGKDRSYFGTWRALDSVAMGADWQW